MKDSSEIKDRLEIEEDELQGYHILYENAGDYTRGWVDALRWVTGCTTSCCPK